MDELEARYYSYHTYYYAFNDKDLVFSAVLKNVGNPDAVYSDENFGMDSS